MRDCSSKKISYSSQQAAITALIEAHTKSTFAAGRGPQNIYRCHICDQYHLTSKGSSHASLKSNSSFSERTQNDILKWKNKFKDF